MEEVYLEIHELYDFFRKYDINELDVLNTILDYTKSYDTSRIISVLNNVYDEKEMDFLDDTMEFNYLDILNKNDLLTEKELSFLYSIVFDANFYLQTVAEMADFIVYGKPFDVSEYPIAEMNELLTRLSIFIDDRNSEVLTR